MDTVKHTGKILTNNLWKLSWRMSWPIIMAMVFYGLNTVFDAILVGVFIGEKALAAVVVAYPLVSLTMGIGSLIGVGAGAILSIAIGENDAEKMSGILGNVNFLSLLLSIAYLLLAVLTGKRILAFMGAEGEILALAFTYFQHTLYGVFFWIYGFAVNMVIRAEGKMKLAAIIMGGGLLINVLLSYILIDIAKIGVAGAAWGSNMGMLLYGICGCCYFRSRFVSYTSNPLSLHCDKHILRQIITLGMAALIMVLMSLLQAVAVFRSVARHGTAIDLAVYGASYRVYTLLMMPIAGFMRALQPVVGINYGARRFKRTVDAFLIFVILSTVCILPIWFIISLYAEPILTRMMPGELLNPQQYQNFRILLLATPIIPFLFMTMTLYPAIGKGAPAIVLAIIRQLIFYIPAMLILPAIFGISSIYIASTVIEYIVAGIALVMVICTCRKINKT